MRASALPRSTSPSSGMSSIRSGSARMAAPTSSMRRAGSSPIPRSASCCAIPTSRSLAQVRSARAQAQAPDLEEAQIARDLRGERVLAAYATAAPLNWLVLVELPEHEANAPLYTAIVRTVVVLLAGLVLALLAALLLARLMVVPVRALAAGAARIGAGQLDHRIAIKSGDELEALGEQLNDMAAQAADLLRDARAQGGGAHRAAAGGQPVQVALPCGGEPRPAPAAARAEPVRCAVALREGPGRTRPPRGAHRHRSRQYERAVQRTARHLQTRCRCDDHQHLRVSGQQSLESHCRHVHPGCARQGSAPAHGGKQRMDPQRSHPARANPDQPCFQRRALHVGRRDRSRLPARLGASCASMCATPA